MTLHLVRDTPVQRPEPWAGKYIGTSPDALGRPHLVEMVTVQFSWGGLLNAEPASDVIHLNANHTAGGSATLCGIDMFTKDAPGWSRGGGVTGPGYTHVACPTCREVANDRFPGLCPDRDMFKLDWSKP